MGAAPGVTVTLVDATPYRLRYKLAVTEGIGNGTIIPNFAGGTTPNLFVDSVGQPPMHALVQLPVAIQDEARHVLAGHDVPTGSPLAANLTRAHCKLSPRFVGANDAFFQVDVDEGSSAGSPSSSGFAVVVITIGTSAKNGEVAYLDIYIDHSYAQNG